MLAPAYWVAPYAARCATALLLGLALTGCAGTAQSVVSKITPYKVEVVQGNVITREQTQALQPGMSRQQVREILGTPLMTSLFHTDRWEYVFTLKRPGVDAQTRRLTVFFNDSALARVEGDDMPSESDFVASLTSKIGARKVPQLEATAEQLARQPKPQPQAPAAGSSIPAQPPSTDYPPLESSRR